MKSEGKYGNEYLSATIPLSLIPSESTPSKAANTFDTILNDLWEAFSETVFETE